MNYNSQKTSRKDMCGSLTAPPTLSDPAVLRERTNARQHGASWKTLRAISAAFLFQGGFADVRERRCWCDSFRVDLEMENGGLTSPLRGLECGRKVVGLLDGRPKAPKG